MPFFHLMRSSDPCMYVQFSHSVVTDSLRPQGLQHASLPCPSPTPGACSDSRPSSRWCHPTVSSSVVPSCLWSFPASFQWVSSPHQVAQVLGLRHQSFSVSSLPNKTFSVYWVLPLVEFNLQQCCCSVAQSCLFATPCTAACHGFTISPVLRTVPDTSRHSKGVYRMK